MANSKRGPVRVQEALTKLGLDVKVEELPDSTRTAEEAAQAVGCQVGQIAKSLVFQGELTGAPYLVITSGVNRVDEAKIAHMVEEEVGLASPDFVRDQTGYAIGGVPPLGHPKPIRTFIDEDLLKYEKIWAAAGAPRAVFPVDPNRLLEVSQAKVTAVS